MNYYPHHIGDYLRDTSHLTALEDGTYRRMLDLYYASEKPLPLDFNWLTRLVRAREDCEREAVQFILDKFFVKHEDGWRNKRADVEIRLSHQRSKVAKQNGKKGGRPRKLQVISGLAKPKLVRNPEESSQNQNQNQNQNQTKPRPAFAVPEWLSRDDWQAFEDSRAKLRKPMTDRARSLVLAELEKLRAAGHDPAVVLAQSVRKGWLDVFPIKDAPARRTGEVI